MLRHLVTTVLCYALWAVVPVNASVLVRGGKDSVVVEARDASIAEVASHLRSELKVNVTVTGKLSHPITGIYSGSVTRVLSRMLAGASFIVNSAAGAINIAILGNDGGASTKAYPLASNDAVSETQGWNGTFSKLGPSKGPPQPGLETAEPQRVVDATAPASNSNVEPSSDSPQGWNPTGAWKIPAPVKPAVKPASASPTQDSAASEAGGNANSAAPTGNSNLDTPVSGMQGWNSTGAWKIPAPAKRDAKPVSTPSPQDTSSPQGQFAPSALPNQSEAVMRTMAFPPRGMHEAGDENDDHPGSVIGHSSMMAPGGMLERLQQLQQSNRFRQELQLRNPSKEDAQSSQQVPDHLK